MAFALSDLELTSPAFVHGSDIPKIYTGEGEDVSPELAWRGVPESATSLVIFCHDPDAPRVNQRGGYGFVHWVVYNIPASVSNLKQGAGGDFSQGKNDFDNVGYNGPIPPPGHGRHQYYFWLLALDLEPVLSDALELPDLLEKIEPHILGMNRLTGSFERQ